MKDEKQPASPASLDKKASSKNDKAAPTPKEKGKTSVKDLVKGLFANVAEADNFEEFVARLITAIFIVTSPAMLAFLYTKANWQEIKSGIKESILDAINKFREKKPEESEKLNKLQEAVKDPNVELSGVLEKTAQLAKETNQPLPKGFQENIDNLKNIENAPEKSKNNKARKSNNEEIEMNTFIDYSATNQSESIGDGNVTPAQANKETEHQGDNAKEEVNRQSETEKTTQKAQQENVQQPKGDNVATTSTVEMKVEDQEKKTEKQARQTQQNEKANQKTQQEKSQPANSAQNPNLTPPGSTQQQNNAPPPPPAEMMQPKPIPIKDAMEPRSDLQGTTEQQRINSNVNDLNEGDNKQGDSKDLSPQQREQARLEKAETQKQEQAEIQKADSHSAAQNASTSTNTTPFYDPLGVYENAVQNGNTLSTAGNAMSTAGEDPTIVLERQEADTLDFKIIEDKEFTIQSTGDAEEEAKEEGKELEGFKLGNESGFCLTLK